MNRLLALTAASAFAMGLGSMPAAAQEVTLTLGEG